MATMSTPSEIGSAVTDPADKPLDLDAYMCKWDQDLVEAGVSTGPSFAVNTGVPALALAMFAAAALATFLVPDRGDAFAPMAVAVLLAACAPWIGWLLYGDSGPTWWFIVLALAPVAALGFGHWFFEPLDLGSDVAQSLVVFPGLLLTILGIAVAPAAMAWGIGMLTYASLGGPLIAAWLLGKDVAANDVVTWHVVIALSVVAGYAIRFSYEANAAVVNAREALAWQAAAEERQRVARDVHDVVAHTLAVTMLHITAARMAVKRDAPDAAVAALEEAERQGRSSLGDIRRIVRLLRSNDAAGLEGVQPGLADLTILVDGYRAAGLPVEYSPARQEHHFSPTAELSLYRVLQEALTNAARHGGGAASVDLRETESGISLRIANPVTGPVPTRMRGSGLLGMRERITAVGGTIEAGIQDGRWIVHAVVPAEVSA
jgi:signal transduction histidine kinase